MSNPNLETSDHLCRDCEYMHPDREGGRWCSSPQALKGLGHSIRCVWERDQHVELDRSHANGTGKCGPRALNYKKREGY